MTHDDALNTLGLPEGSTPDEIKAAAAQKKSDIEEKMSAAPTDALKAKFKIMLKKVTEAEQALLAPVTKNRSPLSETKMADLPGAAPTASTEITLQVGDKLSHDRYEIKQLIGQGGMGSVYHAYDNTRGEDIAIKVLLPSMVANARAKERFLNEAKLSSRLSHPNITNVFDVQEDGEFTFLTMELLDGQDVRQLMDNRKLTRQEFSESEATNLASMLADALQYAHEHTVHRDIKPENIWITEDGQYKLMDFGIARVMNNTQRTQTGMAMGTAYYMAPEQLTGTSSIDGRADQYALGILLYELLVGNIPTGRFKALREVRKDLNKKFAAAIDKTLESDPDDRFADMAEFKAALLGGKVRGKSKVKTSKVKGNSSGQSKKTRIIAAVASLAIIGVLGATGTLTTAWDSIRPLNEAERLAIKQEALTLQGEIKGAQAQISNINKGLVEKVREQKQDLKRTKSELRRSRSNSEKKSLRREQEQTEKALFEFENKKSFLDINLNNASRAIENETQISIADTFIREKEYQQAIKVLKPISKEYKTKLSSLRLVDSMMLQVSKLDKANKNWRKIKPAYVCDNSVYITNKEVLDKKIIARDRLAYNCKRFAERLTLARDLSRSGEKLLSFGKWSAALPFYEAAVALLPKKERYFHKRNIYKEKYKYQTSGMPRKLNVLIRNNDIDLANYPNYFYGKIRSEKARNKFTAALKAKGEVHGEVLDISATLRPYYRNLAYANVSVNEKYRIDYETMANKVIASANILEEKGLDIAAYYKARVYAGTFDKEGNSNLDSAKIVDHAKALKLINGLLSNKAYQENRFLLSLRGMLKLQLAKAKPEKSDALREAAFSDFNTAIRLNKRRSYNVFVKNDKRHAFPPGAFYQMALHAEAKGKLKLAAKNHRSAIVRAYKRARYLRNDKGATDTPLVKNLESAHPQSYQWLVKHKDKKEAALEEYVRLLLLVFDDSSSKTVNDADIDEIVKYIKLGSKRNIRSAKEALYAVHSVKKPTRNILRLSAPLGGYQPKKAFRLLKQLSKYDISYKRSLANAYTNGKGTAKNKYKAVKLYESIVKELGDKSRVNDYTTIAKYYLKNKKAGSGKKAFRTYMKAYKKSPKSTHVNNQLGYVYYKGIGVTKNLKKSHNYFLAGAKLGGITSMGWVISNYIYGRGPIKKSESKAAYWIKKLKVKAKKSDRAKKSLKRYKREFERKFK